jgi:hypothetical protein
MDTRLLAHQSSTVAQPSAAILQSYRLQMRWTQGLYRLVISLLDDYIRYIQVQVQVRCQYAAHASSISNALTMMIM